MFYALSGVVFLGVAAALLLAGKPELRAGTAVSVVLLVLFGYVVERGTVCMSSMLKEWFMGRSPQVWRTVLFTVMCLALLYQLGILAGFYEPVKAEEYIFSPLLLVLGSFLLGFGFIFADGCFIGSLWKAGQGNVINMVGILGLLTGIGMAQVAVRLTGNLSTSYGSRIPADLSTVIGPWWFLAALWIVGSALLIVFRQRHYRY